MAKVNPGRLKLPQGSAAASPRAPISTETSVPLIAVALGRIAARLRERAKRIEREHSHCDCDEVQTAKHFAVVDALLVVADELEIGAAPPPPFPTATG